MFCVRKNIPIILITLLLPLGIFGQPSDSLKEIVSILCSDSMGGRKAGTQYEKKAALYIAQLLEKNKIGKLNGDYFSPFSFQPDSGKTDTAINIIGFIDNKAKKTILISAHYDHIGFGGRYSRSPLSKKIHPGADDNACGVAALLKISAYLETEGPKNSNYCIAFFSGHEEGLFGSNDFVNNKYIDLSNIELVINLDMIGRLDTSVKNLVILGEENNTVFDSIFIAIPHPAFNVVRRSLSQGDYTPFNKQGIPCLSFTTGIHDDYHKPSDTPDKINFSGLSAIINFIEQMIVLDTEKK
jgi:Zn-dependent M28 family amino/carboxypeptidase